MWENVEYKNDILDTVFRTVEYHFYFTRKFYNLPESIKYFESIIKFRGMNFCAEGTNDILYYSNKIFGSWNSMRFDFVYYAYAQNMLKLNQHEI